MMKFAMLLFAVPLLVAVSAKAEMNENFVSPGAYSCRLSGSMKGLGIAIGIGGEVIKGRGVLACMNTSTGRALNVPVKLSLIGAGAGLEFSRVRNLTIRTAGIRVINPGVFFRSYGLGATVGATLLKAGVDFDAAFRVNGNAKGEGFEVGITGRDAIGLGAHLYGMTFKIKEIR